MSSTWTTENGEAVWDGRRLDEWAQVVVADLVAEFDPAAVWLYGSVAHDDDDGDSDIDLLIVLDSFDPRDAIALKVRAFKASPSSAPFDVSFTDPDRYQARSQTPARLNGPPFSTGDACINVADRPDTSAAAARSWLAKADDDLSRLRNSF